MAGKWVKSPGTIQPHPSLHGIEPHEHPVRLIPTADPQNGEQIQTVVLSFGVICYEAINNWYTNNEQFIAHYFLELVGFPPNLKPSLMPQKIMSFPKE